MSNFSEKEAECLRAFNDLGPCYHLWTPENFEIIFRNEEEFRFGMGIVAIAVVLFSEVKVLTFELMTNHIHIMAAGPLGAVMEMFELIGKMFRNMAIAACRTVNWNLFKLGIRRLDTLADARNVIIYDNRNGFLVRHDHTPFSYPWGANICYFNPDSKKRFLESSTSVRVRTRRKYAHSHMADDISCLRSVEGVVSPFSFCDIDAGESLFRDASHYFFALGKNIEQNKEIAKEIGESISYTEEELFAAISARCKQDYGTGNPSQIDAAAKIEMAKLMRFNYNATSKQIQRMLRLSSEVVQSLFG